MKFQFKWYMETYFTIIMIILKEAPRTVETIRILKYIQLTFITLRGLPITRQSKLIVDIICNDLHHNPHFK